MKKKNLDAIARRIVDEIVHDIEDRRGLKQEWAKILPADKCEVARAWMSIVREVFLRQLAKMED